MYCNRSKIAVIDDESELAQLYTEALDANGYEATAFSDSNLALEEICLKHTNYSMVISDNRMPGLNGMELLTQIQQKDDKIKFILISAFGQIADRDINFTFLPKPIMISAFIATVKTVLRSRKLKKFDSKRNFNP